MGLRHSSSKEANLRALEKELKSKSRLEVIHMLFEALDDDGNGHIDWKEFEGQWLNIEKKKDLQKKNSYHNVQEAILSSDDVQEAMKHSESDFKKRRMLRDKLRKAFTKYDKDKNGLIEEKEFVELMMDDTRDDNEEQFLHKTAELLMTFRDTVILPSKRVIRKRQTKGKSVKRIAGMVYEAMKAVCEGKLYSWKARVMLSDVYCQNGDYATAIRMGAMFDNAAGFTLSTDIDTMKIEVKKKLSRLQFLEFVRKWAIDLASSQALKRPGSFTSARRGSLLHSRMGSRRSSESSNGERRSLSSWRSQSKLSKIDQKGDKEDQKRDKSPKRHSLTKALRDRRRSTSKSKSRDAFYQKSVEDVKNITKDQSTSNVSPRLAITDLEIARGGAPSKSVNGVQTARSAFDYSTRQWEEAEDAGIRELLVDWLIYFGDFNTNLKWMDAAVLEEEFVSLSRHEITDIVSGALFQHTNDMNHRGIQRCIRKKIERTKDQKLITRIRKLDVEEISFRFSDEILQHYEELTQDKFIKRMANLASTFARKHLHEEEVSTSSRVSPSSRSPRKNKNVSRRNPSFRARGFGTGFKIKKVNGDADLLKGLQHVLYGHSNDIALEAVPVCRSSVAAIELCVLIRRHDLI